MRNRLYSLIVIGIFFGGMFWNIYCYLESKGILGKANDSEFSEVMGRSRLYYAGPGKGRFYTGIFQETLEKASSDHFPLFAIYTFKKMQRLLNKEILSIFPTQWTNLLPLGKNILLLKQKQLLVTAPSIFSQSEKERVIFQADYYNKILEENPSIRLFVVPVLYKSDWLVISNYIKINSKIFRGDQYVREFRSLLDSKISYFWPGEELGPEKAISLYFKSDHHLSMIGVYVAYCQLMNRLQNGEMKDEQCLKPDRWFAVSNVKFRGSEDRIAGAFEDIYDIIEDADFKLPNYLVRINGIPSELSLKKKYLDNIIPPGKFVNHHTKYFGGDYGLIELTNPNLKSRNILVIGDSYDNPMVPLISSHYHQSYFVDLRHFETSIGTPFILNDFIRQNKINDVVFFANQEFILGLSPWSD